MTIESQTMQDITPESVSILYTNHRGETATRKIIPVKIWFGATKWHSEPQWLLDAVDIKKNAKRSFALKEIRAWFTE